MLVDNFGEIIKSKRISKGLTQKQLATSVGLATSTINRIEQGTLQPRIKTIIKISGILGVSHTILLSDNSSNAEFVGHDMIEWRKTIESKIDKLLENANSVLEISKKVEEVKSILFDPSFLLPETANFKEELHQTLHALPDFFKAYPSADEKLFFHSLANIIKKNPLGLAVVLQLPPFDENSLKILLNDYAQDLSSKKKK